jgi:hypothetical protein
MKFLAFVACRAAASFSGIFMGESAKSRMRAKYVVVRRKTNRTEMRRKR